MEGELICIERGRTLVFHAKKCGMTFLNIAYVIEWETPNPALIVPRPLGIKVINEILKEVKRLGKKKK